MRTLYRTTMATLLLPLFLFALSACQDRPITPGGNYKSRADLYQIDSSIRLADASLGFFVASAKGDLADRVKAHRDEWIKDAGTARDIYALTPTPENKSKADAALLVLTNITDEVTAYLKAEKAKQANP